MSSRSAMPMSMMHLQQNSPAPPRDGTCPRYHPAWGVASRGTKRPVPSGTGRNPRYHPVWRRRPLFSGTGIPAPLVTGGEPGQVYFPKGSVAGSGGMFGWLVRTRLAPAPGSLGVRPNLLVSVNAVVEIIAQPGRNVNPSRPYRGE